MKKIIITMLTTLTIALTVIATELPGYDDLQTTIGKAVSIVEVWIKEAKTSSAVDGPNTLEVWAQVKETIAGEKIAGEIRGTYEEFHAPRPTMPNFNIDYANYSGSGQELRTKSNDRVLLLISVNTSDTNTFKIVRVEPVSKKQEIVDLFNKKNGKPQPAGGAYVSPAAGDPSAHP